MLKNDRFLLAILIGLIVLAVVTLTVVLTQDQAPQVFAPDSPEAVV